MTMARISDSLRAAAGAVFAATLFLGGVAGLLYPVAMAAGYLH